MENPSGNGLATEAPPPQAPSPAPPSGSAAPPPTRAWLVALSSVLLIATATWLATHALRRYHMGQIGARRVVIRGDEVFADVEEILEKYRQALSGYDQIIAEAPKLAAERNRLLLRKAEADRQIEELRARTDITAAQREEMLVEMERRAAGIQIDLNTNKSAELRIPTAQKNKTMACKEMRGLLARVKTQERQVQWNAHILALCAVF